MRPGQEIRLATPSSNLGSFLSKCTVLKKKHAILLGLFGALSYLAPGAFCPPCPHRYAPSVTLRDKLRSCEIRRALNVEPLLRIKISQLRLATLVRPCIQNAQRKTGEAHPAG